MAKAKSVKAKAMAAPEPEAQVPAEDSAQELDVLVPRQRWPKTVTWPLYAVVLLAMLWGGFNIIYAGKVYPGVSANGVYLGRLGRDAAIAALTKHQEEFQRQLIPVRSGADVVRISPDKLDLQYQTEAAVDEALSYGHRGNWTATIRQQLKSMLGRRTAVAAYTYNDAKLTPLIRLLENEVRTPVVNASLSFNGENAVVNPSQPGKRLDIGRLVLLVEERLAGATAEEIVAPVYDIPPAVDTAGLEKAKEEVKAYLQGPITLARDGTNYTVTVDDIISWIIVTRSVPRRFETTGAVTDFIPRDNGVEITLVEARVNDYVANLAKKIDRPGQDAALTITDGRATVFQPSRDGFTLNRDKTIQDIKDALAKAPADRRVALEVVVFKPKVREENLNDLGIKELISEGVSYFPGSPRERMQNIRVGAALYNGILLAPDQVFSFGEILGDVGPETGYAPAKVIIGNRQEYQYGGGLCQVSSTAYRAALLAGLPITQRTNHSFAVSYYTAPYGVPGVDATIYYPQVDMKFKNDTGSYMLIQTVMQGTTLKFQFYGTKTKEGRIRGPFFVSGSLNDKEPSHTVFYRDILDLSGNVTKTDTVHTRYKSSEDFPSTPQYQ